METRTSILQGLHKGWWMWCHWISRMPIYMCQFCPAGGIFSWHPGTRQGSLLFINGKVFPFGPATTPKSFTKLTCICKDASCIHTVMASSMLRCLPTRQHTLATSLSVGTPGLGFVNLQKSTLIPSQVMLHPRDLIGTP